MNHDGSDDDDLLVVTGGVPRPASSSSLHYHANTPNNNNGSESPYVQTDAEFAFSLQRQRAEMRLAAQHADNLRYEATAENHTLRSVVPLPEGLPSEPTAALGRGVAPAGGARKTSTSRGHQQLDAATANARVAALEDEVKALNNQLHNQSRGLTKMTVEAEKQSKLIAMLNVRIDKEAAANRDLQGKLKLAEAQVAAHKKELQIMQREAGGITGVTTDTRLQKALEEIAQLKAKILTMTGKVQTSGGGGAKGGSDHSSAVDQPQAEQLLRDNRILEAQRAELLNCIRKQNKLIEVLRRQKLHLEAAKLLQMTEEDFTRVLEAH